MNGEPKRRAPSRLPPGEMDPAGGATEALVTQLNRLEVDLAALDHNLAVLREATRAEGSEPAKVCAVVKADAYGLGAAPVAHRLQRAGADLLAVYTPDEARHLTESGVLVPVLILSPVRTIERADPLYWSAVNGRLHFSVHDEEQVATLATATDRLGVTLQLHIEVDTGMARGGMRPDIALRAARTIAAHPRLRLAGVYTHFIKPRADHAMTLAQHRAFGDWLEEAGEAIPADCLIHEANTFGAFRSRSLHRRMVRVGLGLYGYATEEMADTENFELLEHAERLRPCARWVSQVAHIKAIPAGQSVGYAALWTAERDSVIALIPSGYADGYPLSLSNKGHMAIEGPGGERWFCPIIGRISMDQITIDATDVPERALRLGAPVEVVGRDREAPNYLSRLAHLAGTTTHEFLARLSPRLPRAHVSAREARPLAQPGRREAMAAS